MARRREGSVITEGKYRVMRGYSSSMPVPPAAHAANTVNVSRQLTPMLRQYLEVKAEHPDAILLYRMGDFYEMFFEDARQAAPHPRGAAHRAQQRHARTRRRCAACRITPWTATSASCSRAGLKVAICDQVEDPAQAKGLVQPRGHPGGHARHDQRSRAPRRQGGEPPRRAGLGRRGAARAPSSTSRPGPSSSRRWRERRGGASTTSPLLRPREVLFRRRGEDGFPAAIREWAERECPCRTPLGRRPLLDAAPRRATCSQRQFGSRARCAASGSTTGSRRCAPRPRRSPMPQETQKSRLSPRPRPRGARGPATAWCSTPPRSPTWRSSAASASGGRRGARLLARPRPHRDRRRAAGRSREWLRAAAASIPSRSPSATRRRRAGGGQRRAASGCASAWRGWPIPSACSPAPCSAR